MIERLEDWPWSSYPATCGQAPLPSWLQTDWILAQFGESRTSAIAKYVAFVHEGARLPGVWTNLQGQVFLGSEDFVTQMQTRIIESPTIQEIPRAQWRAMAPSLTELAEQYPRDEAMAQAYRSGQHTMLEIAKHFGVHYATVSRAVKRFEGGMLLCKT